MPALGANRSFAAPRQAFIAATPALQEREPARPAALADALADGLRSRGVGDLQATLAARIGMAAFARAATAWLDEAAVSLGERRKLDYRVLREILGDQECRLPIDLPCSTLPDSRRSDPRMRVDAPSVPDPRASVINLQDKGNESMSRFEGKVVIVTGGGSGIGAAIAERFSAEGAALMIAGRDAARLDAQVAGMAGAPVAAMQTDVSRPAEIERLVAATVERFGKLDILVNNAGSGGLGRVDTIDPAVWHTIMATDLDSVFYGARHAVPHLVETAGSIVNISSICGVAGDPGFSAYNAAKAGVINLTRALGLELAGRGVRVNCVSPGLISTPSTDQTPAAILEKWHALIPMRRAGNAAEIAGMVAFLASSDASYITCQNFVVDGGITSHTGQVDLLSEFGM